jgi:hypothetical protein
MWQTRRAGIATQNGAFAALENCCANAYICREFK